METWLSRAEDCPLSISFAIPSSPLPPHIGHIIQHSSHWRNITLRMLSGASFRALSPIVALPLLHTLRLDGYGCHIEGQEEFFSLLHSASNLRKISWYIPTTSPCSVNLPWKALTDFHSQCDITVTEVVKILSDAPQLKRLVVYISDSLKYPFPLPSVVHNHLRELEITTRRHVTGIFEALTLPALEILYINDQIHSCANWPHEQFLSFLLPFRQPTLTRHSISFLPW